MAKAKNNSPLTVDYHRYDRWFAIAKVLLVIPPFVAFAYLQITAGGGDLSSLLREDPGITVTFLSSMAGPFIAYLLWFAQKRFYTGDAVYMMANLSLLFAAALLLRNMLYLMTLLYLMYLVYKMTGMTPVSSLRAKGKDHFFRDLSGCFVLILFAAFCLFVSLRLGM